MDEQFLQELLQRVMQPTRPTPPLAQLFRDLAFLTADVPVDSAGAQVRGPFPDFRAAGFRQGPVFNERAKGGFESLAQLFEGAAPLSAMEQRDQPADATAVARGRLLERLAAHDAIERLPMREEFAGRESEMGGVEETSALAALIGAGGLARGLGQAVARRTASRVAQREAGDIFREAERRVMQDVTQQARRRATDPRVTNDPLAELRRLLNLEDIQ